MAQDSGTEIISEFHDGYEIHFLPYKMDWLDKAYRRWGNTKLNKVYLLFFFFYSFLELPFLFCLSPFYRSMLRFSRQKIKSDNIGHCIISAAPFNQFKVGARLKKTFKNLHLIADYRDDWTTNDLHLKSRLSRLLDRYTSYFEKRWLSFFDFFVSVSQPYVDKIARLIKRPGFVSSNGFVAENYKDVSNVGSEEDFTICYSGSLAQRQPVEIFLEGVKKLVDHTSGSVRFKVRFIGLEEQLTAWNRVKEYIKGYESYFDLMPKISKADCVRLQQRAHVLLLIKYEGMTGVPGSKMYEYLALKKPVLLCPGDNDILEHTMRKSGQGIFVRSSDECFTTLKQLYADFLSGSRMSQDLDLSYINSFNRDVIAKDLVDLINKNC